jgi:hypothetical protein
MTRHLDATGSGAVSAVVDALEHERGTRRLRAVVVAELLSNPDGSLSWLVRHGVATAVALAPSGLLRALAQVLEAAAAEQEERQLQ